MCKSNHSLYTCSKFINLPIQDRINFVHTNNICKNCLRTGHGVKDCKFGPCRLCHVEKHNSLIHVDSVDKDGAVNVGGSSSKSQPITNYVSNVSTSLHTSTDSSVSLSKQTYSVLPTVLLSTALVDIADSKNFTWANFGLLLTWPNFGLLLTWATFRRLLTWANFGLLLTWLNFGLLLTWATLRLLLT